MRRVTLNNDGPRVGLSSSIDGNTVGFGYDTDAVYGGTVAGGTASALELTTTWAVNAAYTHFWDPAWKSTLWGCLPRGELQQQRQQHALRATGIAARNGTGTAAVANAGCNMDWAAWGAGLRTEWAVSSLVPDRSGSAVRQPAERNVRSDGAIAIVQPPAPASRQALYAISDQDNWAVRLRVNRNFYP